MEEKQTKLKTKNK